MDRRIKDITGQKYGKWTVVALTSERSASEAAKWLCRCECGSEKAVAGSSLRNGSSQSCGCIPVGVKSSGMQAYKRMYRSLTAGAASRGLPCDLTFEAYVAVSKQPCFLCGEEPYEKRYAYNRLRYSKGLDSDEFVVSNGVDRLDSANGYVVGNIAACCTMCNRMKSDFSLEDFKKRVRLIAANTKEREL